jgi:hypothetical protein
MMRSWPLSRATNNPPSRRGYPWVALWAVPTVAVPVADGFLPPDIHLAHLLVVPLALATTFTDTRRTAATAVLAMAAVITAALVRSALTIENVLVQVLSLVLFSVLLLRVSHRREQHQRQLAGVRRAGVRGLHVCGGRRRSTRRK